MTSFQNSPLLLTRPLSTEFHYLKQMNIVISTFKFYHVLSLIHKVIRCVFLTKDVFQQSTEKKDMD